MKKHAPLQTGVEMIYGIPGSGKSLMALRRLLDVMRVLRRPVYTNLPLQFPVVRAWLRKQGGEQLAKLIVPLDRAHFAAFIARFARRRAFIDAARLQGIRGTQAETHFLQENGPDVLRGPGANWIPAGACIIIDEVHHWFPNPAINKATAPEPPELLAYLTMHRHVQHWVWCITQDARQVSTTFKSLASLCWKVWAKDSEPLAFGLTFRTFGLRVLAYAAYPPEAWRDGEPDGTPGDQFLLFPQLPNTRWLFRLYRSFTHVGSASALRRQLERARIESGLLSDGSIAEPTAQQQPATRNPMNIIRRTAKLVALLMCGVIVLALGVAIGNGSAPQPDQQPDTEAADTAPGVAITDPAKLKLRSVLHDVVVFDDDTYARVGDMVAGCRICAVDGAGAAALDPSGRMWVWRRGHFGLQLGEQSEVERVLDQSAPGWRRGKPGRDLVVPRAPDSAGPPVLPGELAGN
jgi:hypothetical protein